MSNKKLSIKKGILFLEKSDPTLKPLFNIFEIEELKPEKNYFQSLTKSIIYQQLSIKAAKTISDRFIALFGTKKYPSPNDVINIEHKLLRSAGLSNAKASYIKNIAQAFLDETIDYKNLDQFSDDEIINQLIAIKGVGPWTAQMFLIFTLNRPDIFPIGDLGVQKGFQQYFKLKKLPSREAMQKKAKKWKPFRTVVSLYLWRVVDSDNFE